MLRQLGDYIESLSAIEAMQWKYDREKWAKVSRSENQLRLTLEISEVVNRNWLLFCGSIFVFPLFKVKWTTILEVWVSSEHCSKIVERYRAVMCENPKKPFLCGFLAQNPFFFDKVVRFITGAPFSSNWVTILWVWVQSKQCNKNTTDKSELKFHGAKINFG